MAALAALVCMVMDETKFVKFPYTMFEPKAKILENNGELKPVELSNAK